MKTTSSFLSYVLGLWFVICNPVFAASSVLVWPVFQTIEADQNGSALWLENRGAADVALQIRVMAWKQQSYEDVYAEQRNVIASPPFSTVAPGERQLIRLMRINPVAPGQEEHYRIIIDEIPPAETEPTPTNTGLRLQMRYLLPLFMTGDGVWTHTRSDKERPPDTATRPILHWHVTKKDGKDMLVVRNTGIVHARLSNVYWSNSSQAKDTTTVMTPGFLGYILPNSVMHWPLPANTTPTGQTLYAQLEDNTIPIMIPYGQ
jgi:fimbrial chaperone protein